jgi:hypothetical protein
VVVHVGSTRKVFLCRVGRVEHRIFKAKDADMESYMFPEFDSARSDSMHRAASRRLHVSETQLFSCSSTSMTLICLLHGTP